MFGLENLFDEKELNWEMFGRHMSEMLDIYPLWVFTSILLSSGPFILEAGLLEPSDWAVAPWLLPSLLPPHQPGLQHLLWPVGPAHWSLYEVTKVPTLHPLCLRIFVQSFCISINLWSCVLSGCWQRILRLELAMIWGEELISHTKVYGTCRPTAIRR